MDNIRNELAGSEKILLHFEEFCQVKSFSAMERANLAKTFSFEIKKLIARKQQSIN